MGRSIIQWIGELPGEKRSEYALAALVHRLGGDVTVTELELLATQHRDILLRGNADGIRISLVAKENDS